MTGQRAVLDIDVQGQTEPQYVDVAGVSTAYRRQGEGEPLVFLHGMGGSNSWFTSHDRLSRSFDLVAPQHPGFGKTARPAWYRSVDDYVPHYADLFDALGIDSAHLVGHSFGAVVAAAFAATYPDRVRSLTIVAPLALPILRGDGDAHDGDAPANLMEMLFGPDAERYAEYDPPEDYGRFILDDPADEYADPEAWSLDPSPGLYRRLARIRAPRQIIVPDEDDVVGGPQVARDWSRWLDAPLVKISGRQAPTAHMLTVQEPEAFADRIIALAELTRTQIDTGEHHG